MKSNNACEVYPDIYDKNGYITDAALCYLHMQYACSRETSYYIDSHQANINTARINVSHVKCDQWSRTAWYGSLAYITWLQYIFAAYPACGMFVQGFCCCCSLFLFVFLFLCCGCFVIHYAFNGFICLYSQWFLLRHWRNHIRAPKNPGGYGWNQIRQNANDVLFVIRCTSVSVIINDPNGIEQFEVDRCNCNMTI